MGARAESSRLRVVSTDTTKSKQARGSGSLAKRYGPPNQTLVAPGLYRVVFCGVERNFVFGGRRLSVGS